MPMLNLNVKSVGSGAFEMEVPDDTTVDVFRVLVFSKKPELGEDMKVIYKGQVLKDDTVDLRTLGVKDADTMAVARTKVAKSASDAKSQVTTAEAGTVVSPGAEPPAVVMIGLPEDAEFKRGVAVREDPALVLDAAASAPAVESAHELAALVASLSPDPVSVQVGQPSPEAVAVEVLPRIGKVVAEVPVLVLETAEQAPVGESAAESHDVQSPTTSAATAPVSADIAFSAAEVEVTPDSLLLMASRLESGEVQLSDVAMLRKTAAKLEAQQGALEQLAGVLQAVNMFSGRALQALGAEALIPNGVPSDGASPTEAAKPEESRSFLIKKGDADVQEMHQRAQSGNLQRSISSGGGSTSTASAPMTREEMDKARKARLEQLESQQAEKKKQLHDAEEKAKSRQALF